MKKLPDTPSALLRHALADVRKAEENPWYAVNMSSWHFPDPIDKVCRTCLGGAVMMGLGIPHYKDSTPDGTSGVIWSGSEEIKIGVSDACKIELCDDLRMGTLFTCLRRFKLAFPHLVSAAGGRVFRQKLINQYPPYRRRNWPEYAEEVENWHEDMEKFAKQLEEAGL